MATISLDNAQFLPHVCQLVDEGHAVSLLAKGNSMRPFIENERDVVVLGRAESVKVGDVVLAELTKGHYVLHRIDRIEGNMVRLRGDGNIRQTEQCRLTDVRAVMVKVVRKGREYPVDSLTWRLYSQVWTSLLPMRRYLLALYRRFT